VIDLVGSAMVTGAAVAGVAAYAAFGRRRSLPSPRVQQAGSSVLLGAYVQHATYWAARPVVRALIGASVSANVITLASIPLAAGAAVAFAEEHWGVGALLGGLSYACDALDGLVARATGTASQAGEVLDALCDRICEGLMLAGVAVAWRGSVPLLALALVAALGAQQVTLASAKTEAFPAARGRVPRGLMRRAERAAYIIGAATAAGALQDLLPPVHAAASARVPLIGALGLLAILGNASAVHRLASLVRVLRREPQETPRAAG
jgi:CDP-diacylglycerol--glycerol-3-phosphate 3-phosphatidyltransferase